MKYKFIPLESVMTRVLSVVPKERVNMVNAYGWAGDALKQIMVFDALPTAVCVAKVENYKAKVPTEATQIIQMMHRLEWSDRQDEAMRMQKWNLTDDTLIADAHDDLHKMEPSDDYEAEVIINSMTKEPMGTYIVSDYWRFVPNFKKSGWQPILRHNGNFMPGECVPNIANCKATYKMTNNNKVIQTSFEKGWLLVSFKKMPKCDGQLQIPDYDSFVPQALEEYIYMRLAQVDTYKNKQGSYGRYTDAKRMWSHAMAKAKAHLLSWDSEDYQNWHRFMVRLTPHNHSYNTGWNNSNDSEHFELR